jgi:hypothetical protein
MDNRHENGLFRKSHFLFFKLAVTRPLRQILMKFSRNNYNTPPKLTTPSVSILPLSCPFSHCFVTMLNQQIVQGSTKTRLVMEILSTGNGYVLVTVMDKRPCLEDFYPVLSVFVSPSRPRPNNGPGLTGNRKWISQIRCIHIPITRIRMDISWKINLVPKWEMNWPNLVLSWRFPNLLW